MSTAAAGSLNRLANALARLAAALAKLAPPQKPSQKDENYEQ